MDDKFHRRQPPFVLPSAILTEAEKNTEGEGVMESDK